MSQEELCPSRRTLLAGAAMTVVALQEWTPCTAHGADGVHGVATDANWVATVKATDLVDGTYHPGFEKYKLMLARDGQKVFALYTRCTHKGCTVKPANVTPPVLACPCHKARFDLDGTVARGPAQRNLDRYPIRLSAKGIVEVDTSHVVACDAKEATLTLPPPNP